MSSRRNPTAGPSGGTGGRNYPSSTGFPANDATPHRRHRPRSISAQIRRGPADENGPLSNRSLSGESFRDATSSMFASAFLANASIASRSTVVEPRRRRGSDVRSGFNSRGSTVVDAVERTPPKQTAASRPIHRSPLQQLSGKHRNTNTQLGYEHYHTPTRRHHRSPTTTSEGKSRTPLQTSHRADTPPSPPRLPADPTQPPYSPPSLIGLSFEGDAQTLLSTLQRLWDDVRMPDAIRVVMTERHIKPFLNLALGLSEGGAGSEFTPVGQLDSSGLNADGVSLADQLAQDPVHLQAFHRHQIALHIIVVDGERRLLLAVVAAYQRRAKAMGEIKRLVSQYRSWAKGHLQLYQSTPALLSSSSSAFQQIAAQTSVMNLLGSVHDRLSNTETSQQRSAFCSVDLVVRDLHSALDTYRLATAAVVKCVTAWQSYVGEHNYCGSAVLEARRRATVEERQQMVKDEFLTARQRVDALARSKSPLTGNQLPPPSTSSRHRVTSPLKSGGFRASTASTRSATAARSSQDNFLRSLRHTEALRRPPAIQEDIQKSGNLRELYDSAVSQYFHGNTTTKRLNGTETPQQLVEVAKQQQLAADQQECLALSRRARGCLSHTTSRPLLQQRATSDSPPSLLGPAGWGTTADIPLALLNTLALSNLRDHIAAELDGQREATRDEDASHLVSSRSPSRHGRLDQLQSVLEEKDKELERAQRAFEDHKLASRASKSDLTPQASSSERVLLLRSMLRDLYTDCFRGEPAQYLVGVSMDWNPFALPGPLWNLIRCSQPGGQQQQQRNRGVVDMWQRFNVDGSLTQGMGLVSNPELSRSFRGAAARLSFAPFVNARVRPQRETSAFQAHANVASGRSLFGEGRRQLVRAVEERRKADHLSTLVSDQTGNIISPIKNARAPPARGSRKHASYHTLAVPTQKTKFVEVVPGPHRDPLSSRETVTTTTTTTVKNAFIRLPDSSHGALHYMHLGHPQSSPLFRYEYLRMTDASHAVGGPAAGRLLALGHTTSSTAPQASLLRLAGGGATGGVGRSASVNLTQAFLPELSDLETSHLRLMNQCFIFLLDEVFAATVVAPLQALVRGAAQRQDMRRQIGATMTIQRFMKGVGPRRHFLDHLRGAAMARIARCVTAYCHRAQLGLLRNAVRHIQRVGRGFRLVRSTKMVQLFEARGTLERFLLSVLRHRRASKARFTRLFLPVQALARGYLSRRKAGEKLSRKLGRQTRKSITKKIMRLQEKEKVARRDCVDGWESQHVELRQQFILFQRAAVARGGGVGGSLDGVNVTAHSQPESPPPMRRGIDAFVAEALMAKFIISIGEHFEQSAKEARALYKFFVDDVLFPQHFVPRLEEKWLRGYLSIEDEEREEFRMNIQDTEAADLRGLLVRLAAASIGVENPSPERAPFLQHPHSTKAHTTTNPTGSSYQPELPALPPPPPPPPPPTPLPTASAAHRRASSISHSLASIPPPPAYGRQSSQHKLLRQSQVSYISEGSLMLSTTPRSEQSSSKSNTPRDAVYTPSSPTRSPRDVHAYPEAAVWSLASLANYRKQEVRPGRTALELLCAVATRQEGGGTRLPSLELLNTRLRSGDPVAYVAVPQSKPSGLEPSVVIGSTVERHVEPASHSPHLGSFAFGSNASLRSRQSSSFVRGAARQSVEVVPRLERMPQGGLVSFVESEVGAAVTKQSPPHTPHLIPPHCAVPSPEQMMLETPRHLHVEEEELLLPQVETHPAHRDTDADEELVMESALLLQCASTTPAPEISTVPVPLPPRLQPSLGGNGPANVARSSSSQQQKSNAISTGRRHSEAASLRPRRPGGASHSASDKGECEGTLNTYMVTQSQSTSVNPKWGMGETAAAMAAASRLGSSFQPSLVNSRTPSFSPSPAVVGAPESDFSFPMHHAAHLTGTQSSVAADRDTSLSLPPTTSIFADISPLMLKALTPHVVRIQRVCRGYLGNHTHMYAQGIIQAARTRGEHPVALTDYFSNSDGLLYRPMLMGRRWLRFLFVGFCIPRRRLVAEERLVWLETVVEPFVRSVYAVAPQSALVSPRRRRAEPLPVLLQSRFLLLERFQAAAKHRVQRDLHREKQRVKKIAQFILLRPAVRLFLQRRREGEARWQALESARWQLSAILEPEGRSALARKEESIRLREVDRFVDHQNTLHSLRVMQRVGRRYLERKMIQRQMWRAARSFQQRKGDLEAQEDTQRAQLGALRSHIFNQLRVAMGYAEGRVEAASLKVKSLAIITISGALKQFYIKSVAAIRIQRAVREAKQKADERYERQLAELDRIDQRRGHSFQPRRPSLALSESALHNTSHISFDNNAEGAFLPSQDPSVLFFNDAPSHTPTASITHEALGSSPFRRVEATFSLAISSQQPSHLSVHHEERDKRLRICQRAARVFLARTHRRRQVEFEQTTHRQVSAIILIMSWFRRFKARSQTRKAIELAAARERHEARLALQHNAAHRIQRTFRGFLGRRHTSARMEHLRHNLKRQWHHDAACVIAQRWRRYVASRRASENRGELAKLDAAIIESSMAARLSLAAFAVSKGAKWFAGAAASESPFAGGAAGVGIQEDKFGLFYNPTSAERPSPRASEETPQRNSSPVRGLTAGREDSGDVSFAQLPSGVNTMISQANEEGVTSSPPRSHARLVSTANEQLVAVSCVGGDEVGIDWDTCLNPNCPPSPAREDDGIASQPYSTVDSAFTPPQHRRWVPPTPSPSLNARGADKKQRLTSPARESGDNDDSDGDDMPLMEVRSVMADDEDVDDIWADVPQSKHHTAGSPPSKRLTGSYAVDVIEGRRYDAISPPATPLPQRSQSSHNKREERKADRVQAIRRQLRVEEDMNDVFDLDVKYRDPPIAIATSTAPPTRAQTAAAPANKTINLSDAIAAPRSTSQPASAAPRRPDADVPEMSRRRPISPSVWATQVPPSYAPIDMRATPHETSMARVGDPNSTRPAYPSDTQWGRLTTEPPPAQRLTSRFTTVSPNGRVERSSEDESDGRFNAHPSLGRIPFADSSAASQANKGNLTPSIDGERAEDLGKRWGRLQQLQAEQGSRHRDEAQQRPSFDQCFSYNGASSSAATNSSIIREEKLRTGGTAWSDKDWRAAPIAPLYRRDVEVSSSLAHNIVHNSNNTTHTNAGVEMKPALLRSPTPSSDGGFQSLPHPLSSKEDMMNRTLADGYLPDSPPQRIADSRPWVGAPRPLSSTAKWSPGGESGSHLTHEGRPEPTGSSYYTRPLQADPHSQPPPAAAPFYAGGKTVLYSSFNAAKPSSASVNTTIEDTYVAPPRIIQLRSVSPPRGPSAIASPPPVALTASPASVRIPLDRTRFAADLQSSPATPAERSARAFAHGSGALLRSPSISNHPSIAVQGPSSTRIQRFPLRSRGGSRSQSRESSALDGTLGGGGERHPASSLSVGGRPAERTLLYSPDGGLRMPPPPPTPQHQHADRLSYLSPARGGGASGGHLYPAYKQPIDSNYLSPLRSPSRRRGKPN